MCKKTLNAIDSLSLAIGKKLGGGSGETEVKSVTITENGTSEVNPTSGKTMSKVNITVNVPAAETEEKTATITSNGTTEITPTAGKTMSKVTVTTAVPIPSDTTATAADIAEGLTAYCGGVKVTGTAVSIGHKVTFIVGNTTKYVYDVANGESITEPPTPSESGKAWFGWRTTNSTLTGTQITFPYTPTADITLYGILDTLAGQTWSGIPTAASAGLCNASVNYTVSITSVSISPTTQVLTRLGIGYATSSSDYSGPNTHANTVAIASDTSFLIAGNTTYQITSGDWTGLYSNLKIGLSSTRTYTFNFVDGTDIANQTLVNWLLTYFTRTA